MRKLLQITGAIVLLAELCYIFPKVALGCFFGTLVSVCMCLYAGETVYAFKNADHYKELGMGRDVIWMKTVMGFALPIMCVAGLIFLIINKDQVDSGAFISGLIAFWIVGVFLNYNFDPTVSARSIMVAPKSGELVCPRTSCGQPLPSRGETTCLYCAKRLFVLPANIREGKWRHSTAANAIKVKSLFTSRASIN